MSEANDENDKTPATGQPAARKPASKSLLDRFINAVIAEFKPELDDLGSRFGGVPVRVCKACAKADDKKVFYHFDKPGLCDRCEEKISAADSIGIQDWVLR